MTTNQPLIEVSSLGVDVKKRTLLSDVSFAVSPGEAISIIGHNGAGKSTLLNVIGGTLEPSAGRAVVLGRDLAARMKREERREFRSEIGHVLQGVHLVSRLTALENVLVGCLAKNKTVKSWARLFKAEELDRAKEALNAVGLFSRASERVDRLSGGERQKIAIARTLVQDAKLILADEPMASLDPYSSHEIADFLLSIAQRRRVTLLTVVHNLSLLPRLSQRTLAFRAGKLVFDLPVGAVSEEKCRELYQGE